MYTRVCACASVHVHARVRMRTCAHHAFGVVPEVKVVFSEVVTIAGEQVTGRCPVPIAVGREKKRDLVGVQFRGKL